MAITISDILMEKGYRIPEDVMISGYDYSVEAQSHCPRITSVRSRFFEIGISACEVLVNAADGKSVQKELYIPDEVIPDEYTTYFRSVIAFGKIRILDRDEAREAAKKAREAVREQKKKKEKD